MEPFSYLCVWICFFVVHSFQAGNQTVSSFAAFSPIFLETNVLLVAPLAAPVEDHNVDAISLNGTPSQDLNQYHERIPKTIDPESWTIDLQPPRPQDDLQLDPSNDQAIPLELLGIGSRFNQIGEEQNLLAGPNLDLIQLRNQFDSGLEDDIRADEIIAEELQSHASTNDQIPNKINAALLEDSLTDGYGPLARPCFTVKRIGIPYEDNPRPPTSRQTRPDLDRMWIQHQRRHQPIREGKPSPRTERPVPRIGLAATAASLLWLATEDAETKRKRRRISSKETEITTPPPSSHLDYQGVNIIYPPSPRIESRKLIDDNDSDSTFSGDSLRVEHRGGDNDSTISSAKGSYIKHNTVCVSPNLDPTLDSSNLEIPSLSSQENSTHEHDMQTKRPNDDCEEQNGTSFPLQRWLLEEDHDFILDFQPPTADTIQKLVDRLPSTDAEVEVEVDLGDSSWPGADGLGDFILFPETTDTLMSYDYGFQLGIDQNGTGWCPQMDDFVYPFQTPPITIMNCEDGKSKRTKESTAKQDCEEPAEEDRLDLVSNIFLGFEEISKLDCSSHWALNSSGENSCLQIPTSSSLSPLESSLLSTASTSPKSISPKPLSGRHGIHVCAECHEYFRRMCDLRKHAKYHTKAFACPINGCSKVFGREQELLRHQKGPHSGVFGKRQFTCDECKKVYSRKDNLQRHLRKEHENKGNEQEAVS